MIPFTSIEVEVVGKRLNRGGDYELEIPVKYRFYGQKDCPMVDQKIRNGKKRARM